MSKNKDWHSEAKELYLEGYSYRAIGTKLDKNESVIRRYLNKVAFKSSDGVLVIREGDGFLVSDKQISRIRQEIEETVHDLREVLGLQNTGPKVLFLDLEVSASIVAAFSMFKHFSTPDHIIQFPYILSFAANWLYMPEGHIESAHLADYPMFETDHKCDKELVEDLWHYFDKADVIVIQNEGFDRGWFTQRCAYWNLPEPSPYRVVCTLKGLKKAMSLPSNSLGYSTKYFNLGHNKLHHDGISLWIDCMAGDVDALKKMEEYNRGDIPTLRELYLKIRAYIPNHPNLALYYADGKQRCPVCGGDHLTKLSEKAYTNLSIFSSYRCDDCGTVKRDGVRSHIHKTQELMRHACK